MRNRTGGPAYTPVTILNWRDPWHPESGGSELYVQQVAERLRDAGREVTWATASYPGAAADEVIDGIRYVRRGGHISVYLWMALLLIIGRVARTGSILEVQNGMPFLSTLFSRRRVTVLVHHVHREQWSVVGPALAKFGWFMESRVAVRINRGNQYVAVSDVTRAELIGLGVRATDIAVAHNAMPPVPEYTPQRRTAAPTLVVLSRLVPHKRIEHAIALLPRLLPEFPGVRLRVMGDGWWARNLCEYAADLGVSEHVDFLGHVEDRTKYEELSRSWLHLMPSVKEGWGLSIIEAASVGVPSIAYADAGGVAESILDGVTGLLAGDSDDFAARAAGLLRDPERLVEMGAKARLRTDEFTWENTAEQIGSLLSK